MIYQQMSFFDEQDQTAAQSFRGGSHVSRTALQDSVKRLVTSVISGEKCGESLARLDQNGSWLRMFGDYCQARMDGSFEEFSGILPTWGLMLDGVLYQPHQLEPYIDESDWRLLPTPTAWDQKAFSKNVAIRKKELGYRISGAKIGSDLAFTPFLLEFYKEGTPNLLNPSFLETMMGFPERWTEINASETQ